MILINLLLMGGVPLSITWKFLYFLFFCLSVQLFFFKPVVFGSWAFLSMELISMFVCLVVSSLIAPCQSRVLHYWKASRIITFYETLRTQVFKSILWADFNDQGHFLLDHGRLVQITSHSLFLWAKKAGFRMKNCQNVEEEIYENW